MSYNTLSTFYQHPHRVHLVRALTDQRSRRAEEGAHEIEERNGWSLKYHKGRPGDY